MSRFFRIGKAAEILGISVSTLRRWEAEGTLVPCRKTSGGTRYYSIDQLVHKSPAQSDRTLAYARVSSHDQKNDLNTQVELLEQYCAAQGWSYEIIRDLGSGMNYRKKGLKRLLESILEGNISRLVLTHKDRLLRPKIKWMGY